MKRVQTGHPPISIPLLVEIDSDGQELTVATYQPLFALAFHETDPFTGQALDERWSLQRYKTEWQSFAPAPFLQPLGYKILLPLEEIPVFKLAKVEHTIRPHDYATGKLQPPALCSMKHSFIPWYQWIWPSLQKVRERVTVGWTVENHGRPTGVAATRPAITDSLYVSEAVVSVSTVSREGLQEMENSEGVEDSVETAEYFDWDACHYIGQD